MFTLTLLGVSAIVLGAAGETLWHVNVSAASGRSRAAGPMAAVIAGESPATTNAGAIGTEPEAKAAEAGAAMLTAPIFKPFVMVRLPVPEGCTGGRVTDVNENGLAVGWLDDTTNSERHPFVFDNATNTTHILSLPSGCTWGEATVLNNDTATLRVVGYARIEVNSVLYDRPLQWDVDLSDWSDTRSYGTNAEYDGYMTAVNDAGSVGAYEYNVTPGNTPSAWRKVGNTIYSSLWVDPQISRRMNSDHAMVGRWWTDGGADNGRAFLWEHGEFIATLDPEDWDYSGAVDINDNFHIVGWVGESESVKVPALWEHEGAGWLTLNPFPAIDVSAIAVALNSELEMAIARDDSIPGAALWTRVGTTDHGIELRQVVLLPDTGDDETEYLIQTATSINDNLWIGGSYVEHQTVSPFANGEQRPCLVIPYDVDNDGEPDYREIVNGIEADTNANWLIDSAEQMRVGLHSPNAASEPEGGFDPVQVVRLGVNLGVAGIERPEGLSDEEWIADIISPQTDCTSCEGFYNGATNWGTGATRPSPSTNQQSEVLVRVHSMLGDYEQEGWGDSEGLPANDDVRALALSHLRTYAFRFAHCIDWLQMGNESYGGAREYLFRGSDLTGQGCTWSPSAGPRSFQEIGQINGAACQEEALHRVLDWQGEMLWEALEASALGGRPLRLTSAGVSHTGVREGFDCGASPVNCHLVTDVADWCNRNQAYFSMHLHYVNVSHVQEAVEKLTNTYSGGTAPWTPPNWKVSTEIGTRANFADGWWSRTDFHLDNTNAYEFRLYFNYPENGSNEHPAVTYETFVAEWIGINTVHGGQWSGVGPRLDDVFDWLADGGFTAACYSARQYDIGTYTQPSPFLIEALLADGVRSSAYFNQGNGSARLTPIKTLYETAGGSHKIDPFTPHSQPCDKCRACPGCFDCP